MRMDKGKIMESLFRTKLLKITGFVIVLMICNVHLLHNTSPSSLIYKNELVAAGEWWRIITHLFVHVSWYHLILDALAVGFLWQEIDLKSSTQKILIALTCGGTSLLGTIWFSPYIEQVGYCGLSGVAHGLMFFLGLLWIYGALQKKRTNKSQLAGLGCGVLLLLLSGAKSVVEVVSGSVVFSELHMGDLGVPIVEAHLGGVIGGAVAFVVLLLAGKGTINIRTNDLNIQMGESV
jgi:rhomboid family GlyGly-CTERM serine protease